MHFPRHLAPGSVIIAGLLSLCFASSASASDAGCSLVAAPSGSDSAAGSEQAPLGSVQKLVDSLDAGQTGCLRAGSYDEAVRFNQGNVTLRSYDGERAKVIGRMLVPEGADNVTVEGLYLDGTNPDVLPSPTVNSDNSTFLRNDVTNNHTAICFSLGHPDYGRANNTTIELNRIHDCGVLPAANHDHGIYVTTADDTTIRNNWIYDNADRGIQLYPDAQRTTITGNVIDGNGSGVIFSGEGSTASQDNTVEGNTITNSKIRSNVESFYPKGTPTGTNNQVRRNCINGGTRDNTLGGIADQIGFTATNNNATDPAYINRSNKDFRLTTTSPCRKVFKANTVPGPDRGAATSDEGSERRSVALRVARRTTSRGKRLEIAGTVAATNIQPAARVLIVAGTEGSWDQIASARIEDDGSFRAAPRMRAARSARAITVKAVVKNVGRSRSVRLRLSR